MRSTIKTIHLLSIAVFFGSVATYIFFGELVPEGDLASLRSSRTWVGAGTQYLTVPSMWLAGITGFMLSGVPKARWLKVKLGGFLIIAANAHLLIYPAIADSIAALGTDAAAFEDALTREAIFGGINVLLIIALCAVAVSKPRFAFGRKPNVQGSGAPVLDRATHSSHNA